MTSIQFHDHAILVLHSTVFFKLVFMSILLIVIKNYHALVYSHQPSILSAWTKLDPTRSHIALSTLSVTLGSVDLHSNLYGLNTLHTVKVLLI